MASDPGDLSGRPLLGTRLDQALFVDRERELQLIERSVERGSNVVILARRGAGKTSFLHRVAFDLERLGRQPVIVSASPAAAVDELLDLIAARVQRHVRLAPPIPERAEPLRLIARLESLEPTAKPDRPISILLDELVSAALAQTLFGRLRDEVWKLPYTWVVSADETHRSAFLRPPADAFFGTVVELGNLDRDQSVELLRRRVGKDLSDALLLEIAQLASGHPRTLLALARDVVLNGGDADRILDEHLKRRVAVAKLGIPAGRVVEYVEHVGPVSASDEQFLESLGWTRNRATQVLNELEGEGILVSHAEKGGRKKIFALAPGAR